MKTSASDKPRSIIELTYQRVVDDITAGKYKPGERMPGDRELAKAYGIGRSSMIRVLEKLQKDRYVERIPVYGTFVRDDLSKRQELYSIAFVMPDTDFSPENIDIASWNGIMEVLQGVFEEASVHPGLQIILQHAPDSDDDDILRQQFENINKFDAVIFCGCMMQKLKQLFAATATPALVILPKLQQYTEKFPCLYFNHLPAIEEMARYIAEIANFRKVILLHCKTAVSETSEIMKVINIIFAQKNIQTESIYIDHVPTSESDTHAMLDARFGSWRELNNTIVWCLNRKVLPVLNYLLNKNQINAQLFGGPANIAAGNIYPPVTYLKEPYNKIGRRAVSMLFNKLKNNINFDNTTLELSIYHGSKPLTKEEK